MDFRKNRKFSIFGDSGSPEDWALSGRSVRTPGRGLLPEDRYDEKVPKRRAAAVLTHKNYFWHLKTSFPAIMDHLATFQKNRKFSIFGDPGSPEAWALSGRSVRTPGRELLPEDQNDENRTKKACNRRFNA